MIDAVEIKIIGRDTETTADAQAEGDKEVYFKLSERPPAKWITIFETDYGLARFRNFRARVSGRHMILEAWLDEMTLAMITADERQLDSDVADTNRKYNDDALYHANQKELARRAAEAKRKQVYDLFSGNGGDEEKRE